MPDRHPNPVTLPTRYQLSERLYAVPRPARYRLFPHLLRFTDATS